MATKDSFIHYTALYYTTSQTFCQAFFTYFILILCSVTIDVRLRRRKKDRQV